MFIYLLLVLRCRFCKLGAIDRDDSCNFASFVDLSCKCIGRALHNLLNT